MHLAANWAANLKIHQPTSIAGPKATQLCRSPTHVQSDALPARNTGLCSQLGPRNTGCAHLSTCETFALAEGGHAPKSETCVLSGNGHLSTCETFALVEGGHAPKSETFVLSGNGHLSKCETFALVEGGHAPESETFVRSRNGHLST